MEASLHLRLVPVVVAFALTAANGAVCDSAAAGHRDRAIGLYSRGDLRAATEELRHAVRACPWETFNRFMLANALYRGDQAREAATLYQSVLIDRPQDTEARLLLGFCLFEEGAHESAVREWSAAASAAPDSAFGRVALAVGLFALGDIDNALRQYEEAVRLNGSESLEAPPGDVRLRSKAKGILKRLQKVYREQLQLEGL